MMFLCMLAVIIAVAVWAIFYIFQGTENEKIGLRELESKEYSSGELIDMDIKSVNP